MKKPSLPDATYESLSNVLRQEGMSGWLRLLSMAASCSSISNCPQLEMACTAKPLIATRLPSLCLACKEALKPEKLLRC